MFGIRVRAHGPAGQGATDIGPALLPVPAMAPGAWTSRGTVRGSPGTRAIAAPDPIPGYSGRANADRLAAVGHIGLGSGVIAYWLPSVYYQPDWPGDWLVPVQKINSSHEMPVPARYPGQVMVTRAVNAPGGISPGAPGAFRARYGGGWPIGWPKISVNYPT